MPWDLREDFAVQRCGLHDLATLVVGDRALELRRDRRRRRAFPDGFPRAIFDHCRCDSSTKGED